MMMETASNSPTVVSAVSNKLEPIDELTVCVPDTPFLSCNLSPSPRSEKDDNISMLGESREPSEEFFRDSSISTLTANSRSTSLSSLTLSSNDHARSNQIPQLKFLTHQNSMFLKKNSPKNSPRVDSPSDDSPSTLTKSQSLGITGTPPQHPPIAKTLSFRTDSTGSLGSLLSNVEIPMGLPSKAGRASSDEPRRESFDSETGLPKRFNNRNVSSILITALKQSSRQAKKSVSFSIPSEDDIARKASKARGLLDQKGTVDAFDDNIPDYQITSPKNSADRGPKARVFASPTKDTPMVEAKQLIKNLKQEAANSPSGYNSQLPPRPPAHNSTVGMTNHLAHIQQKPPNGHSSHHSNASNGHISHHGAVTMNGATHESNGEAAATQRASAVVLPLMQRIHQATTARQFCEVFGIATESVFSGEVMKKRFSKDLMGKERHVWIEPRTKSIHWAKNAHDRHANVKVKYFLLDKNNPSLYIGADRPMSSSSTATTATAASLPGTRADASNNNSSSSAAENIDTTDTTSSNTIEAAPGLATPLLTGLAPLLNSSENNTMKAQGHLVGIIHSATINHLSIRIQTESGDYLNLTIHSGKGATQRAKDWFEVIKTLTKDITPL